MDKKSVLALFLIFIVLILWEPYKTYFFPPEEIPEDLQSELMRQDTTRTVSPQQTIPEQVINQPAATQNTQSLGASADSTFGTISKTNLPKQRLVIETPLYMGTISTKGGTIDEWILNEYPDRWTGEPVNIIRDNKAGNLGLNFLTIEGLYIDFSDFDFIPQYVEAVGDEYRISLNTNQREVTLTADLGEGRYIHKKFVFDPNVYEVTMEVTFENLHNLIASNSYSLVWGSGMRRTEENIDDENRYTKTMALFGSDIEDFDIGSATEIERGSKQEGTVSWMATRGKYFTSLIVPLNAKGSGYQFSGQSIPSEVTIGNKSYYSNLFMHYPATRDFSNTFMVYLGPADYYTFKNIENTIGEDLNLIDVLDYTAFIKPLSILIYKTFNFLHGYIPNYGFVIIIFSLLVNLLMFPLTSKSYKSIKKMQTIQPLMNEIKEKYKDEPQKIQQATMKMYKEHKINPMGGCLPLLFQMPIFFAIYPVFRSIELRGAPFIFWIKDLSVPDTVYILPFSIPFYQDHFNILTLVYAISMFIQQKIMVNDPKQKMMVYLMPVMMLLMLNRLSSGFILYFIIFNLLSISQRFLVRDKDETVPVIQEKSKAGSNEKPRKQVQSPKKSGSKKTKKK